MIIAEGGLIETMNIVVTIPMMLTDSYSNYCIMATSIASVSFVNLLTMVPFGVMSKKLNFVRMMARVMFMWRTRLALMAILTNVYSEKKLKKSVKPDTPS